MTTELDCSITMAKETVYGTPVATSRAYEFVSETFDWTPTFSQGAGLRVASRLARAKRRKLSKSEVGGDMTVECVSKGMGYLWNACLGVSTSTIIGAGPGYQQLHTVATTDYLPSYTIQKGIPPLGGGATLPHTFAGMVASSFDLSIAPGGILTLKVVWVGKSFDTSTAYAAPTYVVSEELFTFIDGAITVGGTVTMPTTTTLATGGTVVADITDWSLAWDNKLDQGGFTLGGAGKRTRSPAAGLAVATGKITAEFDTTTLRDAFVAQTDLAMVLTFQTTNQISAGVYPTIQVVLPDIRLDSELPKSNGGAPVVLSMPYTVLDNLVASPLQVAVVTTDTAI